MITNATHITLECLILMGKVGFNQHIELGVPNFNIYSISWWGKLVEKYELGGEK